MLGKRTIVCALLGVMLAAGLSGCSMVGYFFSGCGSAEADLVIYNNSSDILGRAGVEMETESQGVADAEGHGLEQGDSWGFELPDEAQNMTVRVYDRQGRQLAQGRFSWPGKSERLWAVYDGSQILLFQWNEPDNSESGQIE